MISALLAILKFLGILLLFCLGLILVILLLVLFVPKIEVAFVVGWHAHNRGG